MAETLAEIIEEHDRREALMAEMLPGEVKSNEWRARDAFARRHFASVIAVAKAGRTLAAAVAGTGSCTEELAAFDAAVRGEGAKAALSEIRDNPTAMGKDIARRYFAEKGERP